MPDTRNTALVPVRAGLPATIGARRATGGANARADGSRAADSGPAALDLVAAATSLNDHAQIERYLPDILGRALARAWIDAAFRAEFCARPKATLAAHRIRLPDSIRIDVVTEGQTRPMVIVSETGHGDRPARRLLYLQLVMVAGK